jgi:hypothetical protein
MLQNKPQNKPQNKRHNMSQNVSTPTPATCPVPSDHFNNLLEQARNAVTCDSECQHRKKAHELKEKYLAAKAHVSSGPSDADAAEKKYLLFTQGQSGYNEHLDNTLHAKADKISEMFLEKFTDDAKNVSSSILTYHSLFINHINVLELYKKYKEENIILEKNLKNDSSDILTNERKTFYEDQGVDSLNLYYYIMAIVYIITLVGFAISIFFAPSAFSTTSKCGILVGLIILPFISSRIVTLIVSGAHKIYDTMPKNVHLNIIK